MRDLVYSLIADHGISIMGWAIGLLGIVATWALGRLSLGSKWSAVIAELGFQARIVVLEVWQTYVEEIKAARADGKLTAEEAAKALSLAMEKLRTRLGLRNLTALGGGLLVKVFAGSRWAERVQSYLEGAVEAQVAAQKIAGKAAGLETSGKDATVKAPVAVAVAITPEKAGPTAAPAGPPLPR